jgi:hypothetical protein
MNSAVEFALCVFVGIVAGGLQDARKRKYQEESFKYEFTLVVRGREIARCDTL